MFLDFLGTLIAFITLLALLSVVVTTLVQFVQATLRLRARNLQMCIAGLLMKAKDKDPEFGFKRLAGRALQAKKEAATLLNEKDVSPVCQVENPTSFWHYYISAPKVSWVEPEQLEKAVKKRDDILEAGLVDGFIEDFKATTPHLKRRFQYICRIYTVILSVFIAVGFQVSTPETFSRLSSESSSQQQFRADASALLDRYRQELEADPDVSETDLQLLRGDVDEKLDDLEGIGLEWWSDEDFFENRNTRWANLIGVLMTAALLSLGAPFWFEQLRRVVNFRDVLAGKAGERNNGSDSS